MNFKQSLSQIICDLNLLGEMTSTQGDATEEVREVACIEPETLMQKRGVGKIFVDIIEA